MRIVIPVLRAEYKISAGLVDDPYGWDERLSGFTTGALTGLVPLVPTPLVIIAEALRKKFGLTAGASLTTSMGAGLTTGSGMLMLFGIYQDNMHTSTRISTTYIERHVYESTYTVSTTQYTHHITS